MRKTSKKDLLCYQFHLIEGFSDQIDHAIFTRKGGVSKAPFDTLNVSYEVGDKIEAVSENRRRILTSMSLESAISARQTHGKNIALVDEKFLHDHSFSKAHPEFEIDNFDGMITNIQDIGLIIKVADCQAILFFDPVNHVLGIAHAGWKGLVQDINGEMIGLMQERFGCHTENILVGVSPSLGPENAYFTDPHKELPPQYHQFILGDHRRVDLWALCRYQLEYYGILPHKIEFSRICTMSEAGQKFYSYRRDKSITGRFALVARLK